MVCALLDHRLIFVTGKGGVGKSTVSTALGMLSARRGLRTIVVELASQDRIQRAFEYEGEQFRELELVPRLFTISLDPQNCMEEYLHVKLGPLAHVIGSSKLFQAFAMATPGMRELLTIGKVWELAQIDRRTDGGRPYDVVIVDAPATGHGVGFLRTPRTFADIALVGPIHHQARSIADTIANHEFTAVVAVTTGEEMPVNETLALRDALAAESLTLDAVIVNALYPSRFADEEIAELEQGLERADAALARSALRAALSEHARALVQRSERARLQAGVGVPVVDLPLVFAQDVGPPELELLADALDAGLEEQADVPA